ncbi:MAG: polyhydroxyalkanoate synthesis repressor PhaR [Betaproteobacteria bacterium]|nr:polyhydroxyalkanoate synthesis repressor PhaR [Betaproteobacteria bacterium]
MADSVRLIKKYPNRRLYDTQTSAYITLADVKELVLKNENFQVVDAKSGDDLTRAILLQIILEEESSGTPMFSCDVLTQFIRFYGNAMQGMMGSYLERNVQLFSELQKKMQEQSRSLHGGDKASQDLWNQFMAFQGPAMQSLVSSYMDQSRSMFLQMQEKVHNQTRNMFSGFNFPGFQAASPESAAAGDGTTDSSPEGEKKS